MKLVPHFRLRAVLPLLGASLILPLPANPFALGADEREGASASAPAVAPTVGEAPDGESGAPAEASATAPAANLRFVEDQSSARLETAVVRLEDARGTVVDLAGAVHIADPSYYDDLNRRFTEYDVVLFEMVGGEGDITKKLETEPEGGNFIRFAQVLLKNALQLEFQLDGIDYGAENFVHADMSAEEFAEAQAESGETLEAIMGRVLKAQIDAAAAQAQSEPADPDDPQPTAAPAPALDLGAFFAIFSGGNDTRAVKVDLARALGQSEALIRSIEGEHGSVILSGRNRTAVKKLTEILDAGNAKVAVFYGAAHLAGLEEILTDDLGFARTEVEWVPAWTIPPLESPSDPETEAKPDAALDPPAEEAAAETLDPAAPPGDAF